MTHLNDGYVGAALETVFGTPVVVTKFFEFTSEGIEGKYENIDSEGMRAGNRFLRADRFVKNPKGANGDLEIEVVDIGFQFFLPFMIGPVTVGTAVGGLYPHTATTGLLDGKSFTLQSNRVDVTGADRIFTWAGCKVAEWELSNSVDELLMAKLTIDASKEFAGAGAGALAKATESYPAGSKLLSFVGGSVKVNSTVYPVDEVSLKVKNGLKDDRYKIAGSTAKLEQVENDFREGALEFKSDFSDMLAYNLMVTGDVAQVDLEWVSPTGSGLKITLPAVRFDEVTNTKEGRGIIEQSVKAMVLHPSSGSSMTAVYTTTASS